MKGCRHITTHWNHKWASSISIEKHRYHLALLAGGQNSLWRPTIETSSLDLMRWKGWCECSLTRWWAHHTPCAFTFSFYQHHRKWGRNMYEISLSMMPSPCCCSMDAKHQNAALAACGPGEVTSEQTRRRKKMTEKVCETGLLCTVSV